MINIGYNQQWIRLLLSLTSGAIGTLSFSPYNIWPAAIVSIFGLQTLTLNRTTHQMNCIGFVWGLGLFGTGISWIYVSIDLFSSMSCVINILLIFFFVSYLSFYPFLFTVLLNFCCREISFLRFVVVSPALWQVTEFLRGSMLTGFPWLQFGYSQIDGPLKFLAPLIGVEGVTFALVSITGLMVYSVLQRNIFFITASILLLLIQWPFRMFSWFELLPDRSVSVALVQGNIAPSLQWDSDHLSHILNIYSRLTDPYIGKIPIIIWPESAIPDFETNQKSFLQTFDQKLRMSNTILVTGILDNRLKENTQKIYNSIIVFGANQPYNYFNSSRYQKNHLVPFGEYVPLEHFFRSLSFFFNFPISGLSNGSYIQPFLKAGKYNLSASICYEVILRKKIHDNFRAEIDFFIVLSNDAWFGKSIAPWQHIQMAQMRSLELGRPSLYSSNNGVTAIIDANGKITRVMPQYISGVLVEKVIPTTGLTPYARWGNWSVWGITLSFLTVRLIFIFLSYIEE
ncbi:Apolipoprotein N-acyltransferase [Candidatus Erwinia haradaeae]|uniref:Apolipoprotein N-acyltransferase n=1 Tax=Candidatus Erwinia haradaeae TaxID=1922217 RepID=A0A451CZ70_9GAMM|nr:apolipoprotein N-acyltransferase [Candidatus Erwinia haradaeae]VFP78727.1 Apolipoprotein N-acyltransferase [Candidatus Erwinia haradaeae]